MSAHVRVPKPGKHVRHSPRWLCWLKGGCRPSPERPDGFEWYFIACLRCGRYL